MLRLTQRGWNNILIFSMLLLFVLFNFSGGLFNQADSQSKLALSLLPEDSVVMSIKIGELTIERVGRGWRLLPQGAEFHLLAALVDNWQQAELKALNKAALGNPQVVTVWLAAEEHARVYQFYKVEGKLLVKKDGHLFQVVNMTWQQLLTIGEPHA